MSRYLHPASERDIDRLGPAAHSVQLYEDAGEFRRMWEAAPWRVQVGPGGDAAILRPWREGRGVLALQALWCPESHVPRAITDLESVARDQGFARLLSPLVASEAVRPYLRAHMTPCQSIVTFRMDSRSAQEMRGQAPQGVVLRRAVPEDVPEILALDALCFDEFWSYGTKELSDYLVTNRAAVAEGTDGLIGYTLCTVAGGAGTLGRLAIHPSARRRGVGTALLRDAVGYMARQDAAMVSLCTQEHNVASRSLYTGVGMRELPGRLELLMKELRR